MMAFFKCIFLSLIVSLVVCTGKKLINNEFTKIPSFLKVCHRSDPLINKCVKDAVELLKPMLKKGIPEFGIPSCEPLLIPEVIIDEGSGAMSIKSSYRDIEVYGPSDFELKGVKIDLDEDLVKIKLYLPHLYMKSKYEMKGRVLVMPIAGKGLCKGNYTDIDATITMQGQRIERDKEIFFNVKDFDLDFNIGNANIQLDDLFDGDAELGESMNLFLNDNWKNVASEVKPVLEDTIAMIFKKFANKIYHKYPLDILLPP